MRYIRFLYCVTVLLSILFLRISADYNHCIEHYANSFYKDVPVLVTGGCGFIGSHLVEKLVELGAQVTILDDLSTGTLKNITSVKDNIIFVQGDITDFDTCLHTTHNKKIIFHCAAYISVPGSLEDPHLCHRTNVVGTHNIVETARINNVKRIVFSSTCAVYGESSIPCHEDLVPNPTSPYGFSKLMGEIFCKEYADVYDMETVMMRYFNVYGSRQNPHGAYAGVIAKFNHNMENNLPITIFGDGLQTRDYVPVLDVVMANIFLGACDKQAIQGQIFNIATGKSTSLLDLIEELKKEYPHFSAEVMYMPPRPGDVKRVSADNSKFDSLCQTLLQYNGEGR